MAASIDFYSVSGSTLTDLGASGLGFYGSGGFGTSVQVGSYQDTTFITNSNGSVNGGDNNNCKYLGNVSGVSVNGGAPGHVSGLPLTSGSLNVRFTFDSAVKVQNADFRIYDRSNKNNNPSGVTAQVAQLVNGGSGVDPTTHEAQAWSAAEDGWLNLGGSGTIMSLLASPGSGGLSPSGSSTEDTRHDWYVCLSASPDSIGAKTNFGAFVELEYL